ncbi:energy transducer TonB [Bartonella sp. HY038]|uniref:energy transducer TonB family protein n=1 Tax=Bartonella sp. HY038 TaxID=2759660 RepID=UPI0015FB3BF2|nr:energy transducer TonB [Bartonella sp. HY038]
MIKSLTVFLSFLLLLPLHSAFAEVQNPTSDNQHLVNDDASHQSEVNQSTALPASPPVISVKPNKPFDKEGFAAQRYFDKNNIDWKGRVQVRIKRFSQSMPEIEGTEGGVVLISFKYDDEGTITSVEVKRPSGNEKLDQYAVTMFQKMATIPKPINGGGTLTVPISFPKSEKKPTDDEMIDDKIKTDPTS